MLSEQQQRIMGYFIEEAKDHLNTIEQGLLNLKATIEDSEMVNEVFRAAHSVKGGAAMLGLTSIQHTAHRLEDYFKILKECSLKIDQKLETLLLRVYDTLEELLEQLQGPFGLTDDKAEAAMAGVEPVFAELNQHLSQLVAEAGVQPPEDVGFTIMPATQTAPAQRPAASATTAVTEESALRFIFQNDVPARLREMLQLFKQADSLPTRQQLQNICQTLAQPGEQLDLPAWCNLLSLTEQAIANPDNTYRSLAPVVIKEIKRAQEQILAGSTDVTASEDLLALLPPEALAMAEPDDADLIDFMGADLDANLGTGDPDEFDLFGSEPEASGDTELPIDLFGSDAGEPSFDTDTTANAALDLSLIDQFDETMPSLTHNQVGPEVGMAELNSLADLFEGEDSDLNLNWQEEVLEETTDPTPDVLELNATSDFSDLLFQDSSEDLILDDSDEDLSGLLNNSANLAPASASSETLESFDFNASANADNDALSFSDEDGDLLFDLSSPDLSSPDLSSSDLSSSSDMALGAMPDDGMPDDEMLDNGMPDDEMPDNDTSNINDANQLGSLDDLFGTEDEATNDLSNAGSAPVFDTFDAQLDEALSTETQPDSSQDSSQFEFSSDPAAGISEADLLGFDSGAEFDQPASLAESDLLSFEIETEGETAGEQAMPFERSASEPDLGDLDLTAELNLAESEQEGAEEAALVSEFDLLGDFSNDLSADFSTDSDFAAGDALETNPVETSDLDLSDLGTADLGADLDLSELETSDLESSEARSDLEMSELELSDLEPSELEMSNDLLETMPSDQPDFSDLNLDLNLEADPLEADSDFELAASAAHDASDDLTDLALDSLALDGSEASPEDTPEDPLKNTLEAENWQPQSINDPWDSVELPSATENATESDASIAEISDGTPELFALDELEVDHSLENVDWSESTAEPSAAEPSEMMPDLDLSAFALDDAETIASDSDLSDFTLDSIDSGINSGTAGLDPSPSAFDTRLSDAETFDSEMPDQSVEVAADMGLGFDQAETLDLSTFSLDELADDNAPIFEPESTSDDFDGLADLSSIAPAQPAQQVEGFDFNLPESGDDFASSATPEASELDVDLGMDFSAEAEPFGFSNADADLSDFGLFTATETGESADALAGLAEPTDAFNTFNSGPNEAESELNLADFELPADFSEAELGHAEPDADADNPFGEQMLETEVLVAGLYETESAELSELSGELSDTETSEILFEPAAFAAEPEAELSEFDLFEEQPELSEANLPESDLSEASLSELELDAASSTEPSEFDLPGTADLADFSDSAAAAESTDYAIEHELDAASLEFAGEPDAADLGAENFSELGDNNADASISFDSFDSADLGDLDLAEPSEPLALNDSADLTELEFGSLEADSADLNLADLGDSSLSDNLSDSSSLDFGLSEAESSTNADWADLNLDALELDTSEPDASAATDLSFDLVSPDSDLTEADLTESSLLDAPSDGSESELANPDLSLDFSGESTGESTGEVDFALADSDAADLPAVAFTTDLTTDLTESDSLDANLFDLELEAQPRTAEFALFEPTADTDESTELDFGSADADTLDFDADLAGFSDQSFDQTNAEFNLDESLDAADFDQQLFGSDTAGLDTADITDTNSAGDTGNAGDTDDTDDAELNFDLDAEPGLDTEWFDASSDANLLGADSFDLAEFDPELSAELSASDELSALLSEDPTTEVLSLDDLSELDARARLDDATDTTEAAETADFDDLADMLADSPLDAATPPAAAPLTESAQVESSALESSADDFADLEALLDQPEVTPLAAATPSVQKENIVSAPPMVEDDEFSDLEALLQDADQTLGVGSSPTRSAAASNRRPSRRSGLSDQTMRVSVKHLDNLNNLVGEMVVNRNSLEQAEERLRQFLDNLLYQVQQLSDVGQRMRDLYERSLLESSLLSSRRGQPVITPISGFASSQPSHATGLSFDALEMDRFTGFHTLSQEMIELIVRVRESASDIDFVVEETDQVTRNFRQITTQLQEGLTRSRMVPFAQTADRLPRGVRDNSLKYGKQAELIIEGRDTLIDKMIVEQLYDPMTHLVNNAIAHGIETPEERIAAGKSPTGRIVIRAFHQGNQTVISVSDDGAGINPERVRAKALAKGLINAAQAREMTRLDTYDLLFHHGFSTADQVDDLRGRGVGLDVVRSNLNEIRGAINIDSTVGKGTTFTIRLPLTLSISKALCCISNRARIAFPMDGVEDMLDVPKERIQTDEQDRQCIQWRDTLLPFQTLAELLRYNRVLGRGSVYGGNQEEDMISIVVLRSAGSFLALQVDQVLGEQEIVIKQLEGPVPKPLGVAGATVLGDGRIMPIADVLELIDLWQGRIRRESSSSLWDQGDAQPPEPVTKTEPTVLIVDDSITVRELLSMTFSKVGYRVEQARDGQEAWEKLRSGLPCDLVFCDIEMPRMDGLELLSRIQKDANLNHLPIAMLTSRGADRHRQMAVQLGAKGYFTKPYLEEVLLDAAQRMLKGEVMVTSTNTQ